MLLTRVLAENSGLQQSIDSAMRLLEGQSKDIEQLKGQSKEIEQPEGKIGLGQSVSDIPPESPLVSILNAKC